MSGRHLEFWRRLGSGVARKEIPLTPPSAQEGVMDLPRAAHARCTPRVDATGGLPTETIHQRIPVSGARGRR